MLFKQDAATEAVQNLVQSLIDEVDELFGLELNDEPISFEEETNTYIYHAIRDEKTFTIVASVRLADPEDGEREIYFKFIEDDGPQYDLDAVIGYDCVDAPIGTFEFEDCEDIPSFYAEMTCENCKEDCLPEDLIHCDCCGRDVCPNCFNEGAERCHECVEEDRRIEEEEANDWREKYYKGEEQHADLDGWGLYDGGGQTLVAVNEFQTVEGEFVTVEVGDGASMIHLNIEQYNDIRWGEDKTEEEEAQICDGWETLMYWDGEGLVETETAQKLFTQVTRRKMHDAILAMREI